MAALRALAAEKTHAHRARFIGRELEAITLHTPAETRSANRTAALTENFVPIELQGSLPATHLVSVRVTVANDDGTLWADLAQFEQN
jgi:hypothetical protein